MNALEAAALFGALLVPLHIFLQHGLKDLPRHARRSGVVMESAHELELSGEVLGSYQDRPIHAWIGFLGMVYRFDRVAPRAYRRRVAERELYLEPGLVYVTD